jgi:hypothetical protein
MASVFTPPTWENKPQTGHRLWDRLKGINVGYGVIRDASGGYTQCLDADDDDIKFSSAFYMGGRSYTISDQEVTDLTAAGYGAYISVT